jgi:hypothetical protein
MQNTDKKSNAGAKPCHPVFMFKILILQRYYNLSDEQTEYQILDRLIFCRFLVPPVLTYGYNSFAGASLSQRDAHGATHASNFS